MEKNMPDEHGTKRSALKTVTARLTGAEVLGREPALLFAARQIEEVLREAEVRPLPFAPDWLLGLCVWRRQTLPVLDPARLHGIRFAPARSLYMVVRVAEADGSLLRCVLKVSDRIAARDLPRQVETEAADSGLNPAFLKGLFAHEEALLLVPDLLPALRPPAAETV
uniref:chemotaxis protein CheW n=1 Tax=Candidatus Electronema sp. TaxID=2698783 RepID=UPI00405702A3